MIFDKIRLYKDGKTVKVIDDIDYIIFHIDGDLRIRRGNQELIFIKNKDYDWFSIV